MDLLQPANASDLLAAREAYLAGVLPTGSVRPVVLSSWERSRAFGVDPALIRRQTPEPALLSATREREALLLEHAGPWLDHAHEALEDHPHLLALADRNGLILRILAGPGLPPGLEDANLFEGASWHEQEIGCNGIGTCLTIGEPVVLIGAEHFQESYIGWTCIGVPLRVGGQIVGALDFSVPNEHVHVHTWGWVLSLARGIEASLTSRSPQHRVEVGGRLGLSEPFQAVRGVFDLLVSNLGLASAHTRLLSEARGKVDEAEDLVLHTLSRLQESEERLRRIFDSGIVGVLFWEMGGRVTWANDRFLEMVGYSKGDLEEGRIDWQAMTPEEWGEADRRAIEQLADRGWADPFEKEFVRSDGSRVGVILNAVTFAGEAHRGMTLVHDVSERRQTETALRAAYEKEQNAVREREYIMSVVSHDLRNPLHTILMAGDLLMEDLVEEKKEVQVAVIRRAVRRMNTLVEDLLSIERLDNGGLPIKPKPVGVRELLEEAMTALGPLVRERGIELRLSRVEESLINGDPDRLQQVLANLVSNAAAHTRAGGRIELSAKRAKQEVLVSVRDTGSGIAPADLPHVFDRYWRSSGSGGVGLGLAIVKGIVESHSGRIWVESSPDIGSTFHFTLPELPGLPGEPEKG